MQLQCPQGEIAPEALAHGGHPAPVKLVTLAEPSDGREHVVDRHAVDPRLDCIAMLGPKTNGAPVIHPRNHEAQPGEHLGLEIKLGLGAGRKSGGKIDQQGRWIESRRPRERQIAGQMHPRGGVEFERHGIMQIGALQPRRTAQELDEQVFLSLVHKMASRIGHAGHPHEKTAPGIVPFEHFDGPAGKFLFERPLHLDQLGIDPDRERGHAGRPHAGELLPPFVEHERRLRIARLERGQIEIRMLDRQ